MLKCVDNVEIRDLLNTTHLEVKKVLPGIIATLKQTPEWKSPINAIAIDFLINAAHKKQKKFKKKGTISKIQYLLGIVLNLSQLKNTKILVLIFDCMKKCFENEKNTLFQQLKTADSEE